MDETPSPHANPSEAPEASQQQETGFPPSQPTPMDSNQEQQAAYQQPPQPGYQPGQPPPQPGYQPGQQPPQPGYQPGQPPPQPGYQPGQPPPQPDYQPGQSLQMTPYQPQQPAYQQQQQQPILNRTQQLRLNRLQQLQGQLQVQQPPEEVQWMPMPQGISGCPPGLEYLAQIDQLLVHQQVELLEVVANIEMPNRYRIKNTLGQQCYFAEEESDFWMRNWCGALRGFQIHLTDNSGREVIRVNRQFKCCSGCGWCATGGHCSNIVEVESPPGTLVGKIVQAQSSWTPKFSIQDGLGREIFRIQGPCCVCNSPYLTQDVPFGIYAGAGNIENLTPVGRICKQYSGVVKELITDATNFSLTFPMDLDVRMKAVLIGATLMIDFMFFERPAPAANNNR